MFSSPSLTSWQWLALPVALPAAWVLSVLLGRATRTLLRRVALLAWAGSDDGLATGLAGPVAIAWFLAVGHAAVAWLGLPPRATEPARQLLHALVYLGMFWTFFRVLDVVERGIANRSRESPTRDAWLPVAVRAVKLMLVGAAAAALLLKLGYPMASLLAGLGVGGLATTLVVCRDGAACPVGATAAACSPQRARDAGIDALRGLAVFIMVGANMVRYMLDTPHPFWLRLLSSLAAPTFVLLAGFMVGQRHVRRPVPFARHLERALGLLLVASLIDILLWKEEPFSSFDVLYVIALVLLASHLALRFSRVAASGAVAVVFLVTPLLQVTLGYETEVAHSSLGRLKALFVDGWFPVFPWLGVGILGAVLGAFRQQCRPQVFVRRVLALGVLLLGGGVVIWWLTAPEHRTCGGFAELFYPPTLGVLFATLGVGVVLLALLSGRASAWIWRGFAVYGRTALAMYVAHLAIIAFVLKPWFDHESLATFVVVYLVHAILLWWLALAIRRARPAPRSFWGRLLLGG